MGITTTSRPNKKHTALKPPTHDSAFDYQMRQAAKASEQKASVTAILYSFDNLYWKLGNHPGDEYVFFANVVEIGAKEMAGNNGKVVVPAYNKHGKVLPGYCAVFHQRKGRKAK